MTNLTFKETISLALGIYKKSFKLTFVLAFMLSFISEYCFVFMIQHGMLDYIKSNGKNIPANFPSGEILALMALVVIVATIFVYAMIILLQGILIKQEMNNSDVLKLALQVFSKRMFVFIGAFFLSMTVMSLLSVFLQYIGMLVATLLFFTVLPSALLEQKNVFNAIKENFIILKTNFFYMTRLTLVVLVLMVIKPFLTFGVIYFLKSIDIAVSPLEISIENIIVTILDSLVIPFIFSIIVATFLATRRENQVV
jgi:hypothetical protein